MTKFTRWLAEKYLPEVAKLKIASDNHRLQRRVEQLEAALDAERAYSRGVIRGVYAATREVNRYGMAESPAQHGAGE